MEKEVKIRGLLVDPTTNTPVVLLRTVTEDLILPIWVGPFEAASIASEIEKRRPQRPMTHDLLKTIITQMSGVVEKVVITGLRDGTFYAIIELRLEKSPLLIVDSRPSDAIALALRCDCPIFIKRDVFDLSKAEGPLSSETGLGDDDMDWPEDIGEA